MNRTLAAVTLSTLLAGSATASELTVTMGGSFFRGPPEYEILADGVTIASGLVSIQRGDVVTLEVGEPRSLAIRYINDLAGPLDGDGKRPKGTDRNLTIEAVEFRGERLLGKELIGAPGVVKAGDFAVVSFNQTVNIPVPSETGSARAEPPALTCPSIDVHLTGYENGKLLPNAEVLAKLDNLLPTTGCSAIITGYSSKSGSAEANKLASRKRAQAALDYLTDKGAVFTHVDLAGWGATQLFGPNEADNRRVVVSLR